MSKFCLMAAIACSASLSVAQTFRKLDNPLPNWPSFYASAISDDGRYVSGWATGGPGYIASKWDMQAHTYLSSPIPGEYTAAADMSGDGSVSVGVTGVLPGVNERAVRWSTQGPSLVPLLAGGVANSATTVTRDGKLAFGVCSVVVDPQWSTLENRIFSFDEPTGTLLDWGVGGSRDLSVSGDGSTLLDGTRYWTSLNGWQALPGLQTFASEASEDGRFIVGKSKFLGGQFRGLVFDRISGQSIDAGTLGGDATLLGVSSNGQVAVGESNYLSGPRRAVWWRSGVGLSDLNVDFASVIPTGWHLEWGTAITPDGRFISGTAMDEVGASRNFVIDTVPEPATIIALALPLVGLASRRRSQVR